jgi:hypothetical protein
MRSIAAILMVLTLGLALTIPATAQQAQVTLHFQLTVTGQPPPMQPFGDFMLVWE